MNDMAVMVVVVHAQWVAVPHVCGMSHGVQMKLIYMPAPSACSRIV
jgi:hypothetical protein